MTTYSKSNSPARATRALMAYGYVDGSGSWYADVFDGRSFVGRVYSEVELAILADGRPFRIIN